MVGLVVQAIHVLSLMNEEDVDARDKPGHDEFRQRSPISRADFPRFPNVT
jgi:hypothetical protein